MTQSLESPGQGEVRGAEETSTLFAHLILQLSNMAVMLMGKTPHPESGQTMKDLEASKLFIDQLEMLEVKTKGNLSKEEAGLLKQTLMGLRLAFVEAVESGNDAPPPAAPNPSAPGSAGSPASTTPEPGEEKRPKFSKKY